MDKSKRISWRRKFIVEDLPEPLTRASRHLQFHDNYLHETRLRFRTERRPETKEWAFILQRIEDREKDGTPYRLIQEIYMTEQEYAHFQSFEGNEIRKNRYFHDIDGVTYAYDVYIGPLWGLTTVQVDLENEEAMRAFIPRPEHLLEITDIEYFTGAALVDKNITDLQKKIAELTGMSVSA